MPTRDALPFPAEAGQLPTRVIARCTHSSGRQRAFSAVTYCSCTCSQSRAFSIARYAERVRFRSDCSDFTVGSSCEGKDRGASGVITETVPPVVVLKQRVHQMRGREKTRGRGMSAGRSGQSRHGDGSRQDIGRAGNIHTTLPTFTVLLVDSIDPYILLYYHQYFSKRSIRSVQNRPNYRWVNSCNS